MKRQRTALYVVIMSLLFLVAAILACNTTNMRAKDMPLWICPTDIIPPTHTMEPGWELRTPPPPTYTPWPSQTPYQLMSDFPLGKHVKIGGVGGIGFGIWVWIDNVEVSEQPFEQTNPQTGETGLAWVVKWDVTVENGSFTAEYEVYPFAQFYIFEVIEANGSTHTTGAWGISSEAHDEIGIPRLDITNEDNVLQPRAIRTYTVAAYIPAPDVWRIGYVLDPLDTEDVEEMLERNTIGSNVGIWRNEYDETCSGEITPGVEGEETGTPPGAGEQLLLGHPVGGFTIGRGFGCVEDYTGETRSFCSGSTPWFHNGIDYILAAGSPAYNVIDAGQATIQHAGDDPPGPDCSGTVGSQPPHNGYGNYVRAAATVNGHTVRVWWAHLSGFSVDLGDTVGRNAVVGSVGSTGCSTGSHLHFTAEVDGMKVDPLLIMP